LAQAYPHGLELTKIYYITKEHRLVIILKKGIYTE